MIETIPFDDLRVRLSCIVVALYIMLQSNLEWINFPIQVTNFSVLLLFLIEQGSLPYQLLLKRLWLNFKPENRQFNYSFQIHIALLINFDLKLLSHPIVSGFFLLLLSCLVLILRVVIALFHHLHILFRLVP